jgi:hypothetical protein
MKKAQENQEGLELSGTYQFPVYADVNTLGKKPTYHKENQRSSDKGLEVLEVNTN